MLQPSAFKKLNKEMIFDNQNNKVVEKLFLLHKIWKEKLVKNISTKIGEKNLLPPLAWNFLLPSFLPNSKLATTNLQHIEQGNNET